MIFGQLFRKFLDSDDGYPFSKGEYVRRMLDKSHRLRECEEKLIWLQARYEYLKATGKEIPENLSFGPILQDNQTLKENPNGQSTKETD